MEDGRKLDVGHVLNLPNGDLEVTAVSYKETEEHGRYGFSYTLRPKDEMDAEREEAKRLEEEQAAAQAEAAAELDTVG